jgi:hypothetical protein
MFSYIFKKVFSNSESLQKGLANLVFCDKMSGGKVKSRKKHGIAGKAGLRMARRAGLRFRLN